MQNDEGNIKFDLKGKVALVTGASRGVGSGIARVLASYGADVAINYNSSAAQADQIAAQLEMTGVRVFKVRADVTKPDEVDQMVASIEDALGSIDILVNNAGYNWLKPILSISVEDWDRTLNLNLRSHFLVSKAVLPAMMTQKWGRIIGISSISGQRGGLSGDVDYSAAKAGIFGFTRCLARHVATSGITVNAIGLGYVWTDSLSAIPEERLNALTNQIPVGRFGTTDECGAVVAFLASEAAAYITGEVVTVNGGVHIA
jgi:3-oxoacyl-[acyl-carrier protein] reductase